MKTMGFFINPVAGEGKKLSLKSSDNLPAGNYSASESVSIGRLFLGSIRNPRTFRLLHPDSPVYDDLTVGSFGSSQAINWHEPSTRNDSVYFVREACRLGADIIVFVGGDGTARDVMESLPIGIPVIGVPSGIKMYSSIFSYTWQDAVDELDLFMSGTLNTEEKEVLDYDFNDNSVKFYGKVKGLEYRTGNQDPKVVFSGATASAIASGVVEEMQQGVAYVIGPGTTCGAVLTELGINGTSVLDFKVVKDGKLHLARAGEEEIFRIVTEENYRILLSPIGGMGILLGRGNYELSERVISKIIPERVLVIGTRDKMNNIQEILIIAPQIAASVFRNYLKVRTGLDEYVMKRVRVISSQ